jgi:hypothetical protein
LKRNVSVTITYADGSKNSLRLPVRAIGAFIHGLIPETARMRRKDRASRVTIKI